jgi:eukaryotic-like serine/threonine-protein kinase
MSDRSERAKSIFLEALEQTPDQWPPFLEHACAGDAALRSGVEQLLRAQAEIGSFHEEPRPRIPETVDESITERPGTVIGHYKLLEQIGEGGFGVVFMAEQQHPVRRKVALKVLKPGMDTKQVIARFEAERQALALMEHPNIARVLDAGESSSGRPYFVMELVRGLSLTDYCDQHNLPVRERLELFIDICKAVQHAHQKGIIHRDIKPTNVLVSLRDGRPVVKVIDFGIAKALGQELTDMTLFTGIAQIIGTPLYMSPEQAEVRGLDIDTRSDIYSLGVLLYELLTGTTPFDKDRLRQASFDEIRRIIREEEPRKPSTRFSTLDQAATTASTHRQSDPRKLSRLFRGELDWIVMKALEKDPNRRYETASAFAADVQRYLADAPVQACPPSVRYRLGKFARRNKRALLTAAVLVLAVVGTLVALVVDDARVTVKEKETKNALGQVEDALGQVEDALEKKEDALGKKEEALQKERKAKTELQAEKDHDWQVSYLRRIALARHEIQANNVVKANQILEECKPGDGQADPRCWEWHYLKRLCRGCLFTITGDEFIGHQAAFSPDGRRLAVGGSDAVFFLDAATGQWLHDHVLLPSYATPDHDPIPFGEVNGHVTFSPDGQCLAAVGSDKKTVGGFVQHTPLVRVWHLATRQEVVTLRCQAGAGAGRISSVAFSPDNQLIATARDDDRTVTVWDAATGREVRRLTSHSPQVRSLAFSPDGTTLATGGGTGDSSNPLSGEVELWDVATGDRRASLQGHTGGINSVAFSPDGKQLASGSGDNTVRVWDPTTGRQLAVLPGHTSYVRSVAYSPDGKLLASGSSDSTVMVWGSGQVQRFRGHTEEVVSVAFSPDSQRLASVDLQNTVKVWDARTTAEARTLRCNAVAAAFSPDNQQLALATWSDLFLHDPTTDRARLLVGGKGNPIFGGFAVSLGFSPDGQRLAAGQGSGTRCWDLTTGKETPALPGAGPRGMFSPDGRLLASANGTEIKVCDAGTGKEIIVLRGHSGQPVRALTGPIQSVSFSADGQRLASIAGQEVKVWDLGSGQAIHTIRGPDFTAPDWQDALTNPGVALSPDGRLLAASGDFVKVWDLTTGQELHALHGHTGFIPLLAFSPDGRRLVTASMDGSVILWDMATGQEAFSFRSPARNICCLAFSPDGRRLVSASRPKGFARMLNEGEVTIWDADETSPGVGAAFQEGQKLDLQLRKAEQARTAPVFGQRKLPASQRMHYWLRQSLYSEMNRHYADLTNKRIGAVGGGRSHSGLGQWKAAAAAYAEVSEADPSAALARYEQSAALLLADDGDGYHQSRAGTLEQFAATPDPWSAHWVARMALLSPNSTDDGAKFVRLAEKAVDAHPKTGPWLQTLGGAHYRAGQYDRALSRLQESEKADWYGYPTIINWLLLAQVHHRLGHAEEARKWLDKAGEWLDQATQKTPKEQADALHLELHDLMACRLLRREAQLLLIGKSDPPNVQNEVAWFLATCADPKLRDPARAVELAQKAVEGAPEKAAYKKTLGVARYGAGDWKGSAAALENSEPVSDGRGATETFFLAMAHWRLDEKEKARQEYESARQWMAKNQPKDEDLVRFRNEAASLLDMGRIVRSFKGHTDAIHGEALSADGSRAITCSFDGTLRLWNLESAKEERCLKGHTGWVTSVALTADGSRALSGSYDKTVRLWDVDKAEEIRQFPGHTLPVECVALSPDGKLAAAGSQDKTLRVWEVDTGKEVHCLTGYEHFVRCVAFSPDGKQILSGSFDRTIRLWSVETGKELRQFKGHTVAIVCVAFSADGSHILSGSLDKTLRLWDAKTGEEVRRFEGHTAGIESLALAANGRRIVSGGDDATARVWDVETAKELYCFDGHEGGVWAVAFTPDGNRVVSGCGTRDGTVLLWELPKHLRSAPLKK